MRKTIVEHKADGTIKELWGMSYFEVLKVRNKFSNLYLTLYKDLEVGFEFLDEEVIIESTHDYSDYWNTYDILINRN